jgi:hypothetical protein
MKIIKDKIKYMLLATVAISAVSCKKRFFQGKYGSAWSGKGGSEPAFGAYFGECDVYKYVA